MSHRWDEFPKEAIILPDGTLLMTMWSGSAAGPYHSRLRLSITKWVWFDGSWWLPGRTMGPLREWLTACEHRNHVFELAEIQRWERHP